MNFKETGRIALLIAGVAACGSITEPERDLSAPIQTDHLSYGLTERNGLYATPPIGLLLTNTSGAPAFLTSGTKSPSAVLESLEGGVWVVKYSKPGPGAGGEVLRLEPGDSVALQYTISGFLPGTCQCSPIIAFEDGVYRLRITEGYVDSIDAEVNDPGQELPLEFRISNSFALDAP